MTFSPTGRQCAETAALTPERAESPRARGDDSQVTSLSVAARSNGL